MANASVSTEETNTTPATEAPENPAAEGSQGLLTQEQVNTCEVPQLRRVQGGL